MYPWSVVAFFVVVAGIAGAKKAQYSYEAQDLMEAAETGPIRGYHVYESEYYPETGGFGGGNGAFGARTFGYDPRFISGQRFFGGRLNRFASPVGAGGFSGGAGVFHHPHAVAYLDKNAYNNAKKQHQDEVFEKVDGKKGQVHKEDAEGYVHGKVALKKDNADKSYYSGEEGGKKQEQDGKSYHEDQHFNRQEKNEDKKKLAKGHRKGHVTKGFRTTHHKDESGKTETFFDEESDESDNFSYDGKSGELGERAEKASKGAHHNGKFNADQRRTEGHYDSEHVVDKGNLDKGEYGQKKFASGGEVYGANKGFDEQSLLGQQEANRLYKHYPVYQQHAPYYSHY